MWDSGEGRARPVLGSVSPRARVEARLALHLAAQPLAAAAYELLPTPEDHGSTNLFWSPERSGFVGHELGSGLRGLLACETLSLGLVREDGSHAGRVDLPGLPLDAALRAFTELLKEAGLPVQEDLRLPDYDLPTSGILAGAPFPAPDTAALAELGGWFDFGTRVMEELSASRLAGAEVRGWPHHFDVAALRTLDAAPGGEEARSVGAGLSPGDELYSEPYFYVSLAPAPPAAELPVLPGRARWHTGGFTGAILTASDVLADAADAPARTRATIDACVRTCLEIVGA